MAAAQLLKVSIFAAKKAMDCLEDDLGHFTIWKNTLRLVPSRDVQWPELAGYRHRQGTNGSIGLTVAVTLREDK